MVAHAIIPALGRLKKQEDHKFEASLSFIVRNSKKKKKPKKKGGGEGE
jgi:hypothetical protein